MKRVATPQAKAKGEESLPRYGVEFYFGLEEPGVFPSLLRRGLRVSL